MPRDGSHKRNRTSLRAQRSRRIELPNAHELFPVHVFYKCIMMLWRWHNVQIFSVIGVWLNTCCKNLNSTRKLTFLGYRVDKNVYVLKSYKVLFLFNKTFCGQVTNDFTLLSVKGMDTEHFSFIVWFDYFFFSKRSYRYLIFYCSMKN